MRAFLQELADDCRYRKYAVAKHDDRMEQLNVDHAREIITKGEFLQEMHMKALIDKQQQKRPVIMYQEKT